MYFDKHNLSQVTQAIDIEGKINTKISAKCSLTRITWSINAVNGQPPIDPSIIGDAGIGPEWPASAQDRN
jgi:hypothetical protein